MTLLKSPILALASLAVVLGSLTACSTDSEAGKTTCGELKAMSADEFVSFLDSAIDEGVEGADDLKSAREQFEAIPEDQREEAVKVTTEAICTGKDDSTALNDFE